MVINEKMKRENKEANFKKTNLEFNFQNFKR